MVIKSNREEYYVTIKKILIPSQYDDKLKELKEDYESKYIWFKVLLNDKEIDVVLPRNNYYGSIFVGDRVKLIRTITLYDNDEFKIEMLKQIDMYYCQLSKEEKNKRLLEIIQKNKTNYIIDYDISLN